VYLNGQSPLGLKSTKGWATSAAAVWGYDVLDGPSTWGAEYPECKSGLEQAPINIVPSTAVSGGVNVLRMYYKPTSGLKMLNNGHTFQVRSERFRISVLLMAWQCHGNAIGMICAGEWCARDRQLC
jgi:carbonic anhydrase